MDIRNLMINDWAYNSHHQKAIQLTPYDFFTHSHHDGMQSFYGIKEPTPIIGRDLEPIPLTEKMLVANKFTLKEKSYCWQSYKISVIVKKCMEHYKLKVVKPEHNNGEWSKKNNRRWRIPEIRYVHELQLALRCSQLTDLANNFKLE